MNADELLRHFERVADAPEAVASLRRFVLDLAIRGKLTNQCPSGEPASELLGRIAAEKARLSAAGLIRLQKPAPSLEGEPFRLPESWCWTQLAEIGLISPRNDAPDETLASFVPMTLVAAEYGVKHGHEIRPWGEIRKGYTRFANEDVGLAKITPCFENGKSTVFRGLSSGIGSGTTELHVVRPVLVSPDFIVLVLKSPHFIQTGIPLMTGTAGQKRVPAEYFGHSPFPLPPLAEQHRIVAKVDELMALCDRLEAARAEREAARDRLTAASLARLGRPDAESFSEDARFVLDTLPALVARPEQVKQLRQMILSLAVTGRLVDQVAADEPAERLVRRIRTGKSSTVAKVPSTSAASHLPASWVVVELSEIADVGTGLTPSRSRPDYFEPPAIPWVTSGETGAPFIAATVQHVSPTALRETSLRLYPAGTLLVAMYGQGKTRGQVTELLIEATTNQVRISDQRDRPFRKRDRRIRERDRSFR